MRYSSSSISVIAQSRIEGNKTIGNALNCIANRRFGGAIVINKVSVTGAGGDLDTFWTVDYPAAAGRFTKWNLIVGTSRFYAYLSTDEFTLWTQEVFINELAIEYNGYIRAIGDTKNTHPVHDIFPTFKDWVDNTYSTEEYRKKALQDAYDRLTKRVVELW